MVKKACLSFSSVLGEVLSAGNVCIQNLSIRWAVASFPPLLHSLWLLHKLPLPGNHNSHPIVSQSLCVGKLSWRNTPTLPWQVQKASLLFITLPLYASIHVIRGVLYLKWVRIFHFQPYDTTAPSTWKGKLCICYITSYITLINSLASPKLN